MKTDTESCRMKGSKAAMNNVAHSYNEDIALGIVEAARENYINMFTKLKAEIEKNRLDG